MNNDLDNVKPDEQSLGQRLKSEIQRIGGASHAASVLKSTRGTLYNWFESGLIPATELQSLAQLGVDASYVITGVRSRTEAAHAATTTAQLPDRINFGGCRAPGGFPLHSLDMLIRDRDSATFVGRDEDGEEQSVSMSLEEAQRIIKFKLDDERHHQPSDDAALNAMESHWRRFESTAPMVDRLMTLHNLQGRPMLRAALRALAAVEGVRLDHLSLLMDAIVEETRSKPK